jgi:predicted porin
MHGVCGIAVALAAGNAAAADSSITLYGVADTYLQYLGNGSAHTFAMNSGGSTGSRFGLKGAEDLGDGLTAQFNVESGFNINNGGLFGDTSTLFYRQSWVGLNDERYGSLTFGRQYDVGFRVIYPSEPFRLDEVLSPFAAFMLTPDRSSLSTQYDGARLSNSVLYQTPKLYGVQAYAMYAFSATVTQPVPATTGNVLDLGINYSGAGLYAGFAYMYRHPGQESISGLPGPLTLLGTEHFFGTLAYRIGIVNLQGIYSYQRANDPAPGTLAAVIGTAHSVSVTQVGATIQATSADEIQLAALYRNVRGAHDNTPGFQVGADHWISKRTSFYMRAGYFKNNGNAAVSWTGVSVTEPGAKQYMAAIGMTHRF